MKKEEILNDILQKVENRLGMYSFLARIFRVEVDQVLLEQILKVLEQDENERQELGRGEELLIEFFASSQGDVLTDLAVDFVKVFIGAKENAGALPYESFYTSKEKLIMQEARDKVVELYRQEGLDRSDKFSEPEDHFAFELEFMAYLCQKSREYLTSNQFDDLAPELQKQLTFVETHLVNWAPDFLEDVRKSAETDFYKAIAMITEGFLANEKQIIQQLMDTSSLLLKEPSAS